MRSTHYDYALGSSDFYLSKTRDTKSAKRFFKKALASSHVSQPRVITVDKNPAYPVAIQTLKEESSFHVRIEIISYSYLDFEGHQSYAYDKKRATSPKGELCPKRG